MGKHYGHVTIEERCEIARLRAEGRSIRQIAAGLDRSPSTVARELKRNGSRTGGYKPVFADQQARARRWRGSRMERDDALRQWVLSLLAQGWSPEQVAGRLQLETGRVVISHESIYRFVYAQLARTQDYSWRHYLLEASRREAGEAAEGVVPLPSWPSVDRLPSAPKAPLTAALPDTGRRTLCCSRPMDMRC